MKKTITILAMLLIAATAYNQSSRRTANTDERNSQRTSREATSRSRTSGSDDNTVRVKTTTPNTSSRTTTARTTDNRSSNSRSGSQATRSDDRSRTSTSGTTNTQSTRTTTTSTSRQSTQSSRSGNDDYNRTRTTTRTSSASQPSSNSSTATRSRTSSVDRTSYHVENQRSRTGTTTTTKHNPSHHSVRHVHASPRVYRESHRVVHHYHTAPRDRYYRAQHYAYRAPYDVHIVWTPTMHRHYVRMYPSVKHWHYHHGYRIEMVSSYFADYYIGEVMTVYGKVSEVYYSRSTDEYFLYFGPYYPYQDFTMVIPGHIARRYSHRPSRYFANQYMAATGLITSFNGDPEIVIRESFQLSMY